jgi:hypothetical protein
MIPAVFGGLGKPGRRSHSSGNVAALELPFVVLFEQQCSDEPHDRRIVGRCRRSSLGLKSTSFYRFPPCPEGRVL